LLPQQITRFDPSASAICPSTVTLADTSPRSIAPT
jgi:hypothetical protein